MLKNIENKLANIRLKEINYNKILDIIIVILLFISCFKRGGFYKSDVLGINLVITTIGIVYILFTSVKNKKYSISINSAFLFILGTAYSLPIVFSNNVDMSDSIFEMIRYFDLYIIYKIVSCSRNKRVYENGIVVVTLIEYVIGVDGIGTRFLKNILGFFNSGYLSKDFTRMSSTIQYANVFAILCAISLVIIIFKILNNSKCKSGDLTIFSCIFSALIFTESRAVCLMFLVYFSYFVVSNSIAKKNGIKDITILLVFNMIFSIVYTALVYNFAMFSVKIYFLTLVFLLLSYTLNYILIRYCNNIFFKNNVHKSIILLITVLLIYSIIALNISSPLYMSDDMQEKNITRNIYDIEKGKTNHISFKVSEKKSDTRYVIKFVEILNDLEVNEIKEVGYFSTSTGQFDFSFYIDENAKCIRMEVECQNGSFTIDNMILNDKNIKLNYLLIPSSIVYKFSDVINKATSISDRGIYYNDALKIVTSSFKNLIIGTGGEGFKNTYEIYQTQKYISTEVHSSFLQIFVESGIIGLICTLIVIVNTFLKTSNKEGKTLLLFFIIHSCIDLEFSYFSIIFLFAILLGICDNNEKSKYKFENKNIMLVIPIFVIMCLMLILVILVRANLAYNIKVNDTSSDILIEAKNVANLEKRVKLDSYDIDYREKLGIEYQNYLKLLLIERSKDSDAVIEEEIKNVLENMKKNADIMEQNSKYNKYVIIDVSNVYFNNMYYFVELYYPQDKEKGYEIYMNYILNNLEKLKMHRYNEIAISQAQKLYNKYYTELKEKNRSINSLKLQEFIDKLDMLINTTIT